MHRVFIVGDIHGCLKTFTKLVLDKIKIQKSDKLYCLGDYIDMGADSKGVIDFILALRKKGYNIHTLRGNHEELLLNSTNSEESFLHWKKNGGDTTLLNFNIATIEKLAHEYINFFKRTKFYIETKDFILVHAGLNFISDNPLKDKSALLWIRNFVVDNAFLNGKILIHGHTPMKREQIISQNFESPLNLDGGCVYKDREGYGSLFALNFYERKLIEVRNID